MKKITLLLLIIGLINRVRAQDDGALLLSGSVDTYYKYDFSDYRSPEGSSNIPTYFGNEQNSISLGMINFIAQKKVGKASFVGDLSFGSRGQNAGYLSGSLPNAEDGNSFHIQNLYVSYQFTEQFSMTAGYMGTFIGYEIISPTGNFNYSTSYLFSSGPFQNAGIKASYAFTDRIGLMVGLFNDWNVYQDSNGVSDFGAQLSLAPIEGWNACVNFLTGAPSGTIIDLTTSYQVLENTRLGLNVADFNAPHNAGGYAGGAIYVQQGLSNVVSLGLRGEYFNRKNYMEEEVSIEGTDVLSLTLSGNIKAGPLTIIPEFRFDEGSHDVFYNSSLSPVKSASQFLIAAVYSF